MAMDVEATPKQSTIMDCMKTSPSPSTATKKSKGIRDFFTSCSNTSIVNNRIVESFETQAHAKAVSEVDTDKSCASKIEERKKKVSETIEENGVSDHKHKNTKTRQTDDDTKQSVSRVNSNQSVACNAEHATTKLIAGKKKKSLSISKKAKDKKNVECVKEPDEKEEKDVPAQDETKDMPQEMDYGEFLKTFVQNQNDSFSEPHSTAVKEEEHPSVQSSPGDKQVLNCSEAKSTQKQCGTKTKRTTDSQSTSVEKSKVQGLTKTKPANAFSILMQAKPNKNKEKPVDDDECAERNEASHGKSTSSVEIGNDTADEFDGLISDVETACTQSLLNFFTKETKSTAKNNECGSSVLVRVDIHCDPAEQKTTPIRKKLNNLQQKKVGKHAKTSPDNDNEIVFLGSETIEIEEDDVKPPHSKKRCLSKALSHPEPAVKTSDDTKPKHSTAEEAIHLENKNAFLQDITTPDQPIKTAQATLHFGQGGKLAMNTSVIAKPASKTATCDSEKIDSTETPQKGAKRKGSEKEVCSSEISELKTTRITKRKREKNVVHCETSVTEDRSEKDHPRQKSLPRKKKDNTENKRGPTRLRKPAASDAGSGSNSSEASGSDAKDFTPRCKRTATGPAKRSRAHELLMKAMQQKHESRQKNLRGKKSKHQKPVSVGKKKKEAEKLETVSSDPEQGTRRQSRRLAEQQKAREATEALNCVNVVSDSDSGSETTPTPQKKNTRKKESCASLRRSSSGASPKKPAGKLAPIFAKKTKESVESSPKKPQEDPEVVRRRREFLLSGVPTELKKQAACSAASAVTSEFAPFPENSHVQQQQASVETGCLDVWSLGTPTKMRTLCKENPAGDEILKSDLKWDSLQWPPVARDDELHDAEFKPLEPVSDVLGKDVREQMIEDLQQSQPGFSVSTLCDKFRDVLCSAAAAAKQQEVISDVSKAKRQKKRTDPDIIIVDEQEDVSSTQTDRDSQWPERLQPTCASEVIGNESSIRRLRYWLEEWKTLIQREARLSARSAAGKDSDFDYSDEDSEEESGQLCNTMMLVGPHGVGKTAAVYALAQQLSYKVFEVNASSSRQGRHILAQLQEATQSHQVAQKKDGIILNPPPVTPTLSSQPEQSVEKKTSKKNADAVPKAFASFFKKSESAAEAKTTARQASPKVDKRRKTRESPKKNAKKDKASAESKAYRKRTRGADDVEIVEETPASKKQCRQNKGKECGGNSEEGEEEGNLAGCLNLTSTSLILFDEVDLVFGEDSGFLQTVQHFINTTKIPIILTTTDPGFQRLLSARLETLVFKRPPVECVSSYLRTVCLAVGMRTSGEDVRELATLCHGDLRCALLHLQFLALSGGGRLKESRPLQLKPAEQHSAPEKTGHGKQATALSVPATSLANGDGNDSDEDFVCLKPFRKKPRRIVDEEDSGSPLEADGVQSERVRKLQGQDSGRMVSADQLPAVHLHLYESMLGVPCHLHDLLARSIKDEYNATSLQQLMEICLKLKASNVDILHTNLLQLLPLPKTGMPDRWQRPSHAAAAVKRKRIRSDIYDSEGSDDESNHPKTESCSLKTVEEVKNDRGRVDTCTEMSADDGSVVKNETEGEGQSEGRTGESMAAAESMEVDDLSKSGEVDNSVHSQVPEVGTEQNQEIKVETEASLKASCQNGESSKCSMKGSQKCTDGGLGSKLLSSFARHYESLSAIDISLDSSDLSFSPCVRGRSLAQPGIEDVPSGEQGCSEDWGEEMAVETEALSCRKLWQQVSTCVSSWKEESCSDRLPDGCSIPLPAPSSGLVFGKVSRESRIPEPYSKVMTEVGDNLPSTVSSSAIALDYLPTLRCISRAEHCRQIAKTKRRFHHHFDNIGLCLSQTTVAALSADFLAGQPDSSDTPL